MLKLKRRIIMGVLEILTLIFIVLKLCGVITWNWWIVLSPEIIAGVIYILLIISSLKLQKNLTKKFKEF